MTQSVIPAQQAPATRVPMARATYTVGRLLAGQLRRALMNTDLTYTEDKGVLDSFFVVRGPAPQVKSFHEAVKRWKAKLDAE